jgi:hypothetical protein
MSFYEKRVKYGYDKAGQVKVGFFPVWSRMPPCKGGFLLMGGKVPMKGERRLTIRVHDEEHAR